MSSKSTIGLIGLFAAYFLTRLIWLYFLPMNEAPDEANHLWVAKFLAENLRLPTAQEVYAAGTPAVYGSLPQLGYLPHVLCRHLFSFNFNFLPELFAYRIGSILIGSFTVLFAYLISKEIFTDNKISRWLLPTIIVFHPQLCFVQSYTNTDSTTITLTSAAIYILIRCIKYGITNKALIALGFLFGWTALSKHTGLAILPAMAIGLGIAGIDQKFSFKQFLGKFTILFFTFTLTCLWWFYRNSIEFPADILGSKTMYKTWSQILPKKNGLILHPWPKVNSIAWWRYIHFDFWGLFGYMNRYLFRPVYIAFLGLSIASLLGWIRSNIQGESKQENKNTRLIWLMFLLCGLLNLIANIYVTVSNVSGPHGRYLFPSIIPLIALMLAGFNRLGKNASLYLSSSLLILCILSNILSCYIYYFPH